MGAVAFSAYQLQFSKLLSQVRKAYIGGTNQLVLHDATYSWSFPNTTVSKFNPQPCSFVKFKTYRALTNLQMSSGQGIQLMSTYFRNNIPAISPRGQIDTQISLVTSPGIISYCKLAFPSEMRRSGTKLPPRSLQ